MSDLPNLPENKPLELITKVFNKKVLSGLAIAILLVGAFVGFTNWKKSSDIAAAKSEVSQLIEQDKLKQASNALENALKKFPENVELKNLDRTLTKIKESKSDFEEGEALLNQGSYSSAITSFKEVSGEDKARYSLAQERLKSAKDKYSSQVLEASQKLLAKKKYSDALEEIRKASIYMDLDAALINLKKELLPLAAEEERKQRAAEEAVYRNALRSMKVSRDKFNGITFYEDRSTPYYANYSAFYLYIGKTEGGDPYLRFRARYSDDDWLFVTSASVNIDGSVSDLGFSSSDWERDNGSGDIWEWADVVPSEYQLGLIKEIINSRSSVVRYFGDKYRDDRTVTAAQKRGFQNVLNAYEALKRGMSR